MFEKFAENKPEHFLNRKLILCSAGKREVMLPVEKPVRMKESYIQVILEKKRVIAVAAAGIAIIAGTVFAVTADMPECYYAVHSSTQIWGGEIYFDINNLPEDFEGKILNYTDPETPMQKVEGNIVTVEYVRGIVSSGLWCGIFGAVFISIFLYVRGKNEYMMEKDRKL